MEQILGKSNSNTDLGKSDRLIFTNLYKDLRRFAAVVSDVDIEPDDLVQDALIAVISRSSLADLDNPLAYMKRIILNQSASKRRRFGIWRGLLPKVSSDSSYEDYYPSDLVVLETLNPTDRAVLYMSDIEGYRHSEIAEQLGLSEPAVRSVRVELGRNCLQL